VICTVLLALFALGPGETYVPPKPIGILGDGTVRTAKKPIPFPSAKTTWIRVRSRHFDIISSVSNRSTRRTAEQLETLFAALNPLSPSAGDSSPTRVLIFGRRRESQPYFDLLFDREGATAVGAYLSQSGGGTMIIDGASIWGANRTPLHELIHDLLVRSGRRPALWIEEGLAEYYSNAEVSSRGLTVGYPIRPHLALMRRSPRMSLRTMASITNESDAAGSQVFYAHAWAAVDWLMRTNRAAFDPFVADLEKGRDIEDALRAHYGKRVEEIERGQMIAGSITTASLELPDVDLTMDSFPLSRADVLYELGAFLHGIEGAEPEGERHFRGALEAAPDHARSLAALSRFEEAQAADPSDPHIYLAHAEHLLGTAIGPFSAMFVAAPEDTAKFRKARALATRALDLGGEGSRALGLIGTSYVVESDRTEGIAALEKSGSTRPDVNLRLYSFYLAAGERAKADRLYAEKFQGARDPQLTFAAKAILLSHELDQANQLARQFKVAEAAEIVRRLAAETPDPKARVELQGEADRLAAVAETNRQIELYNAAVTALMRGEKRTAQKHVQELLAVVTDAELLESVRALQRRLKR
jgi:hypothetical protein